MNISDGKISLKLLFSDVVALLPVLMVINVPVVNVGMSTLLVLLFIPYSLYYIFSIKQNLLLFLSCLIAFGYIIIRCVGTSTLNVILYSATMLHIIGFQSDSICVKRVRFVIEKLSCILTVLVIIQMIAYYIFGVKFTYLSEAILLAKNRYMVPRFLSSEVFFRPSAIFMEPAHYAQYTCVGIVSTLFPDKGKQANIRQAVWIAVGCLLTRSGIGIIMVFASFFAYILFINRGDKKGILRIVGGLFVFGLVIVILNQFPFFEEAVSRIFGEYKNGNAIWGRTVKFGEFIKPMTGLSRVFGNGGGARPDNVYMTGSMELIYEYGYVGLVLYFLCMTILAINSRNIFSFIILLYYFGLSLAADVIGFVNVLFFAALITYKPNIGSDVESLN